jgi:hypothetical protein
MVLFFFVTILNIFQYLSFVLMSFLISRQAEHKKSYCVFLFSFLRYHVFNPLKSIQVYAAAHMFLFSDYINLLLCPENFLSIILDFCYFFSGEKKNEEKYFKISNPDI